MKKVFIFLASLILCASLAGCQTAQETGAAVQQFAGLGQNAIRAVQFNKNEKAIVSCVFDNFFMFEVNVDENHNWMHIWAIEYRSGKKVKKYSLLQCGICGSGNGSGTILLYSIKENIANRVTFNVCLDGSSNSDGIEGFAASVRLSMRACNAVQKASIPASGDVALACLRYDKGTPLIYMLTSENFFDDYTKHLDLIKDFDVTYVIGCTFSKHPY